jgi:hypothetical protein
MTQDQEPQGIQLGRILAGDAHMDVVYFLAMTFREREAVKIGTSTRLKKRVSSVSYAAEMEDVILLVPGGHDVETLFHNRFREYQIQPFAELFWREGRLGEFLAMAPAVSFATAFAARVRRRFTKNPKAKPEPKYKPQPELQSRPEPALEAAPDPEPEIPLLNTPMSLLEIVRAFIVPEGTAERQAKYTQRLRQDRYRSDKGELRDGLVFPEPVEVDSQTEKFLPAAVIEFNEARRGRKVA